MTNVNTAANLYDFADLTGVPEDLANALQKERTGRDQVLYNAVVAAVVGAPVALGIKQIMVVLIKMGIEIPAETTVRSYLNAAHEAGAIGKPSRQSYWTVESNEVADAEEAQEAAPEAGAIGKPSRQSYWTVESNEVADAEEAQEAAPEAAAPVADEEDDILAGLED